jgi:hypothetical protein
MADITMCDGYTCPIKKQCYRYMANANDYYQSYFADDPRDHKGNCSFYWRLLNSKNDEGE